MRQQDVDQCVLNIFMHEYIYQRHNQGSAPLDSVFAAKLAAGHARIELNKLKGEANREQVRRAVKPERGTMDQGLALLGLYKKMFPRFTMPEEPLNPIFLRRLADAAADGLDVWEKRFELVRKSDFLMGKAGHYQATLPWLILPKVILKLESGGYV